MNYLNAALCGTLAALAAHISLTANVTRWEALTCKLFLIGALALAPITSHAQDVTGSARLEVSGDVWITYDPGGEIAQHVSSFAALERSGARVVIDGLCESACTLILGIIPSNRLCVTPRARFGFHAAWRLDDDRGQIINSSDSTKFLIDTYSEPLRNWIEKNGGLTSRMIYLTGNGLFAIDRQVCMEKSRQVTVTAVAASGPQTVTPLRRRAAQ
jgi:hypothetical protein